jgi:hypothetical protein
MNTTDLRKLMTTVIRHLLASQKTVEEHRDGRRPSELRVLQEETNAFYTDAQSSASKRDKNSILPGLDA